MNAITLGAPSAITKGNPRLLFATLMLGMMAQGLAFTAFVSALPQMAQEFGSRGVLFAQMTMALAALGLMFGALAGGWHLAFAQYLVFGAAAFALAFVGIGQANPEPDPVARARQPYFRRLLPFYLLAALLFAVLFMASTQYAFLLQQDGIADPAARSLILATVTVTGALMAFIYGPLQKLLSARGTFLFGLVCMILALAATGSGLTVNPAFAVGCAVLMGIYAGLVLPYLYQIVVQVCGHMVEPGCWCSDVLAPCTIRHQTPTGSPDEEGSPGVAVIQTFPQTRHRKVQERTFRAANTS